MGYFLGLVHGGIALDDTAITADQKLGEVPFDGFAAQQTRRLCAQPLVKRVGVGTIDIDLLHHGETHAVIDLAKIGNDFVARRILVAKLIARKTQNSQTLVFVGQVDFFKATKLWRETAGAGGVHDQHDLALQLAQGQALAVHLNRFKIVNGFHGIGLSG